MSYTNELTELRDYLIWLCDIISNIKDGIVNYTYSFMMNIADDTITRINIPYGIELNL